jgi:hypothetical protein
VAQLQRKVEVWAQTRAQGMVEVWAPGMVEVWAQTRAQGMVEVWAQGVVVVQAQPKIKSLNVKMKWRILVHVRGKMCLQMDDLEERKVMCPER